MNGWMVGWMNGFVDLRDNPSISVLNISTTKDIAAGKVSSRRIPPLNSMKSGLLRTSAMDKQPQACFDTWILQCRKQILSSPHFSYSGAVCFVE